MNNLDISRREALKVIGAGAAAIAASSYGLGILNPPRAEAAVYSTLAQARNAADKSAKNAFIKALPNAKLTCTTKRAGKKIVSGPNKGKVPYTCNYKVTAPSLSKTASASYYAYVTKNKKRVRTTKSVKVTYSVKSFWFEGWGPSSTQNCTYKRLKSGNFTPRAAFSFSAVGFKGDIVRAKVNGVGGSTMPVVWKTATRTLQAKI